MWEPAHAGLHVALLFPSAYLWRRFAPARFARRGTPRGRSIDPVRAGELTDRLTRLEESLDAAALSIERIGEGQRFMTRVLTDNAEAPGQPLTSRWPAPPART
jgi:hypothetical protein